MNRLQTKIQTEIDTSLVKLKSDPALTAKIARLRAELSRLELAQQEPTCGSQEITRAN